MKKSFVILNGRNFIGSVPRQQDKFFFNKKPGGSEKEYYNLLLYSQSYFDDLQNSVVSKDDKRIFIAAPAEYISMDIADRIYHVITKEDIPGWPVDAHMLYFERPLIVKKVGNNYMFHGPYGQHRFFIAQKYKLNILVCVLEDEE